MLMLSNSLQDSNEWISSTWMYGKLDPIPGEQGCWTRKLLHGNGIFGGGFCDIRCAARGKVGQGIRVRKKARGSESVWVGRLVRRRANRVSDSWQRGQRERKNDTNRTFSGLSGYVFTLQKRTRLFSLLSASFVSPASPRFSDLCDPLIRSFLVPSRILASSCLSFSLCLSLHRRYIRIAMFLLVVAGRA